MNQTKIEELENRIISIQKELVELKAQPTELVKSWEDAFNGDGYWIDSSSEITDANDLSKEDLHKSTFKTEHQAKSALAFAQLSHIVADANGDWVADWNDEDQMKYVIEAGYNKLEANYYCSTNHFLPMKSAEIRDACLEKHRTLWEDFWMISK